MTSAALAALVHAVVVAGILLLPGTASGGDGIAATVIPVTLVEPVAEATPAPAEPEPAEPEPVEEAPSAEPAAAEAPPALTEMVETPEALPPPPAAEAAPVQPADLTSAPSPLAETPAADEPPTVSLPPTELAEPAEPAEPAAPEAQDGGDGRKQADGMREAAMTAYLVDVRQQLMRHAPKAVPGARDCEVEFQLTPPGAITSASLRTSSGSPRYDRRCLKAVEEAAPFPAAPDGTPDSALHFRIEIRQQS